MRVTKLDHSYENFQLYIDNLEIGNNKIIGLIGENGAGKTTFMDILSGTIPANGQLHVENMSTESILYIPSNLQSYDYLTVKDFLSIILSYSTATILPLELANKMGLEDKLNEKIGQLSEGMRKKLSLVNLFIHNYAIVILDEPFNSIDLKYIHQLKQLIRTIKHTSTVIISSHILDTLMDICDEFVYLENGKIKKVFVNNKTKEEMEAELFE